MILTLKARLSYFQMRHFNTTSIQKNVNQMPWSRDCDEKTSVHWRYLEKNSNRRILSLQTGIYPSEKG